MGKPLQGYNKTKIQKIKDKIKKSYKAGLDDEEVCRFCEISKEDLDFLLLADPHMRQSKEEGKSPVNLAARVNIADDIIEKKNVRTSRWYLEHTDPDFSSKQNVQFGGVPVVVPIEQKEEELKKLMEQFVTDKDFNE